MLDAAVGLTRVTTGNLKKALSALHQGHFTFPLTIEDLTRVGLQHCANDFLGVLRKADEHGVRAVLVAVIAERLEQQRQSSKRSDGAEDRS